MLSVRRYFLRSLSTKRKEKKLATNTPVTSKPKKQPTKSQVKQVSKVASPFNARRSFNDIQNCHGLGLSTNVASTLLLTMAKQKQVAVCAEMLRYFEKQDVSLKPFALLTAFSAFCEAKQLDEALSMFETLYRGRIVLEPWVFGWALDAASTLNRQDLVASIFRRLVAVDRAREEDCVKVEVKTSKRSVSEMLHDAHTQGVRLSEFALRALVSFADKAYESDLALDAISMMQDRGMALSNDLFNNVLKACGKNERWSDVLDVFEIVPEDMYEGLSGSALGSVVMALSKSGDEELIEIGLELFNDHPSKWFGYACNAAMEALLQTRQFDEMLSLANEMKEHRLKWSPFTYRMVVVALIRNGSIDEARKVLDANAKRMQNESAACYGELINHYAQTRVDTVEALHLCEEMLQNNWHIHFPDWCTALNLTHELPQQSASWRVRKQLWLRAESFGQKIPYNLLVLQRPSTRNQVVPVGGTPIPVDVSFGLEVFNDFRSANGSGLTNIIATKLLETMAHHNRIDECLEMLDFFSEQGVFLKPTGRMAVFRAFCISKEDGQALKIFESMLVDDLVLKRRNFSTILVAAMEFERHEVVINIIDRVRKQGKSISNKDYKKIDECFGHDEKWRLTLNALSTLAQDIFVHDCDDGVLETCKNAPTLLFTNNLDDDRSKSQTIYLPNVLENGEIAKLEFVSRNFVAVLFYLFMNSAMLSLPIKYWLRFVP